MKFVTGRVVYALLFYVLCVLLIFVSKPSLMFSSDGTIKTFGVGNSLEGQPKTVFSFGVAIVVISIMSFYVFALIDVVFSKKTM
jgi:hypothetical protein